MTTPWIVFLTGIALSVVAGIFFFVTERIEPEDERTDEDVYGDVPRRPLYPDQDENVEPKN